MRPTKVQLFSTDFSHHLITLCRCGLHPCWRFLFISLGDLLSLHLHHSLLNHCLPAIVVFRVQFVQDNLMPESVMTQRLPSFVDQKRLVEDIGIENHYNMAPKRRDPTTTCIFAFSGQCDIDSGAGCWCQSHSFCSFIHHWHSNVRISLGGWNLSLDQKPSLFSWSKQ